MKVGLALLVFGVMLLALGVFLVHDSGVFSRPSYGVGMGMTAVAFVRLAWASWHGSLAGTVLLTLTTVILTWALYELVRQTPGVPNIGFLDEMTAPVLSTLAGVLVLVAGLIRVRARRTGAPNEDDPRR